MPSLRSKMMIDDELECFNDLRSKCELMRWSGRDYTGAGRGIGESERLATVAGQRVLVGVQDRTNDVNRQ